MTSLELLASAGALAGQTALKKAVNSIYDSSTEAAKKILRRLKNETQLRKFCSQIGKVRKVKTLGQVDKAVDLASFYCSSHVYFEGNRSKIDSFSNFKSGNKILIEGIAGQGKSIFLRYLCSIEFLKGDLIPIFAELRKISENESLENFLIRTFKTYHLDIDKESLSHMANTGKLILFLDAFDEAPDDSKSRLVLEMEDFLLSHESVNVVISSRPNNGISACSSLDTYSLSNLEKNEYADVIDRIMEDAELAQSLIARIKKHTGGIKELLITPLLVTLLVIRYKSFQELPEQLADFYDSLFQVLLQRHDGTKPGYQRRRRTSLNDTQYRQTFEAMCFLSKKQRDNEFTHSTIHSIAESALKEKGHDNEDSESYIKDIVGITCLLVNDGETYRFIHKSVQEYYVASYIKNKPEIIAKSFFQNLFKSKSPWNFTQEIKFLEEIDAYRFYKFGVIPALKQRFGITALDLREEPKNHHIQSIQDIFERMTLEIIEFNGKNYLSGVHQPDFGAFMPTMDRYFTILLQMLAKEGVWRHQTKETLIDSNSINKKMSFRKYLLEDSLNAGIELIDVYRLATVQLFELGIRAVSKVENEEKSTQLFI
ncbi:hypothetical protein DB345_03360 [Spartobacteria bacterium LR76]|nr:hypothetical protein DB345_03360 [Spartobacteria bacterium LR76]